jgi:hypothetical protein
VGEQKIGNSLFGLFLKYKKDFRFFWGLFYWGGIENVDLFIPFPWTEVIWLQNVSSLRDFKIRLELLRIVPAPEFRGPFASS